CTPMAPRPIAPARRTGLLASLIWLDSSLGSAGLQLPPPCLRSRPRERPCLAGGREPHAVGLLRRRRRNDTLPHIGEHALRVAGKRIAVSAAAGRVQPENVARLQRIVGIARRQAPGLGGVGIDPDIAAAAGVPAGAAVRRGPIVPRADGKTRLGGGGGFPAGTRARTGPP